MKLQGDPEQDDEDDYSSSQKKKQNKADKIGDRPCLHLLTPAFDMNNKNGIKSGEDDDNIECSLSTNLQLM